MKGRPSIVPNTDPLIALAAVGQLALLSGLFHVIVPESVAREFAVGKAAGSKRHKSEVM
jgi:predicted nucleic acid-binding protein